MIGWTLAELPGYTASAVGRAANRRGQRRRRDGRRGADIQRAVARAYNSPFGLGGARSITAKRRPVRFGLSGGFPRGAGGVAAATRRCGARRTGNQLPHPRRRFGVRFNHDGSPLAARQLGRAAPPGGTGVWRGHLVRRSRRRSCISGGGAGRVQRSGRAAALGLARGTAWSLAHVPSLGTSRHAVGLSRLGGDNLVDRLLNVLVLVTMHLAWGAGFIQGWLFGGERTVDRSRVR